jgi:hypothetical protein
MHSLLLYEVSLKMAPGAQIGRSSYADVPVTDCHILRRRGLYSPVTCVTMDLWEIQDVQ